MRTTNGPEGTRFHHDGDYSGELLITVPHAPESMQGSFGGTVWRVHVPFADVRALVLAYLRDKIISDLEEADDDVLEKLLLR